MLYAAYNLTIDWIRVHVPNVREDRGVAGLVEEEGVFARAVEGPA